MTRPRHRQSLLFGWKTLLSRGSAVSPVPRARTDRQLEPWLVALLVLVPPAGFWVWWRRYDVHR